MFNKIINPVTNRKVNTNSKLGNEILQTYLNNLSGGRLSAAQRGRRKETRTTKVFLPDTGWTVIEEVLPISADRRKETRTTWGFLPDEGWTKIKVPGSPISSVERVRTNISDDLATLEYNLLGHRQPGNIDMNERLNNLEREQRRRLIEADSQMIIERGESSDDYWEAANEIPDGGWTETTRPSHSQRILDLKRRARHTARWEGRERRYY